MNISTNYRKVSVCLWTLVLMLLFNQVLLAQEKRISGKVTSADDKLPIPGVSVNVKGSTRGVSSDVNGNYIISAKEGEILVFKSIGYQTQERKVGAETTVNIVLSTETNKLNEVVVVGYGTMKKTDVTSSQVTVTSADLQRTVNTTLDQALQGRAANVVVTSNSGQPGAAPSIVIRGLSSINGSNQPLYVIDGVQFKPDDSKTERPDNAKNAGNFRTSGVASNFLATINPDDIETINVLQGPSATAIYGAAGAGGVVLITTKRGK